MFEGSRFAAAGTASAVAGCNLARLLGVSPIAKNSC